MVSKRLMRFFGTLLILMSVAWAVNASGANTSIGSYHIGLAGSNMSGSNSNGSMTIVFSQPVSDFLGDDTQGDLRWGEVSEQEIRLAGGGGGGQYKEEKAVTEFFAERNLFPLLFLLLGVFLVLYYLFK